MNTLAGTSRHCFDTVLSQGPTPPPEPDPLVQPVVHCCEPETPAHPCDSLQPNEHLHKEPHVHKISLMGEESYQDVTQKCLESKEQLSECLVTQLLLSWFLQHGLHIQQAHEVFPFG
ncbi:hypothetical protein H8959_015589 [Pygathrix nigripes]